MFEISPASFEEGKRLYASGASLRVLMDLVEGHHAAIGRATSETERPTKENWREHEFAAKSLMLGFVDGALDDLRRVANGGTRTGGQRA